MSVRTLVLPVAGMGKRLRPLTLRRPKALVELNGQPLIEYVLEEGRASGIRDVVIIASPQHRSHFEKYIVKAENIFPSMKFYLRMQERPMGNGHALIPASDIIGNRPVAVRFCDDLLFDKPPVLSSLIRLYDHYRASVLLLERVPKKDVTRYGVVGIVPMRTPRSLPAGNMFRLTKIVEKPALADAPSNLIIVGGYILAPQVLRNLRLIADSLPVAGNDALPIAVAFQMELVVGGKLYGWEFSGKKVDCGTLDSFRKAEEEARAGFLGI
jgi:UTP--glucose-1-phosphate uridylyltransferase